MNITPQFVFVHLPKTGGSFVSDILRKLHHTNRDTDSPSAYYKKSLTRTFNKILGKHYYQEFNKHGTCNDIPKQFRNLDILSCMRNPFDWYVSNYKFAWWKTNPEGYPELQEDPRWPNLSFADYLELSNSKWLHHKNPQVKVNPTLGRLTTLFINYYCKNPDEILKAENDDNTIRQLINTDQYAVTFMDTTNLNNDTFEVLLQYGYPENDLQFIHKKKKVRPRGNRTDNDKWQDFYNQTQIEEILQRDRFLFEKFPKYKI